MWAAAHLRCQLLLVGLGGGLAFPLGCEAQLLLPVGLTELLLELGRLVAFLLLEAPLLVLEMLDQPLLLEDGLATFLLLLAQLVKAFELESLGLLALLLSELSLPLTLLGLSLESAVLFLLNTAALGHLGLLPLLLKAISFESLSLETLSLLTLLALDFREAGSLSLGREPGDFSFCFLAETLLLFGLLLRDALSLGLFSRQVLLFESLSLGTSSIFLGDALLFQAEPSKLLVVVCEAHGDAVAQPRVRELLSGEDAPPKLLEVVVRAVDDCPVSLVADLLQADVEAGLLRLRPLEVDFCGLKGGGARLGLLLSLVERDVDLCPCAADERVVGRAEVRTQE